MTPSEITFYAGIACGFFAALFLIVMWREKA